MRKPVDIEWLLTFAYRDELPKTGRRPSLAPPGWGMSWGRYFALGTRVDESRHGIGFPEALGDPHPDALLIDYRVRALEPVTVVWGRSCGTIMGHLEPYAPADDPVLQRMQFQTSALVQMHARMGTRPCWDLGPVRLKRIIGKNGKTVVNGITAGRRYAIGAACPLQLDPPGREIASARAEYFVWRSALDLLAAEIKLSDFTALPPRAAAMPWLEDTEHKPRILRDKTP